MSVLANKRQVLDILVENLQNKEPQVVESCTIAKRLNMSVKDTCQLIKIMNSLGVVEADSEGLRALITREGVRTVRA